MQKGMRLGDAMRSEDRMEAKERKSRSLQEDLQTFCLRARSSRSLQKVLSTLIPRKASAPVPGEPFSSFTCSCSCPAPFP